MIVIIPQTDLLWVRKDFQIVLQTQKVNIVQAWVYIWTAGI